MGILDDLKKQADGVRAREARDRRQARAEEDVFESLLQPCMKKLYAYLEEFVRSANVVKPSVVASYEVTGFGVLRDLRQGEYRLSAEDPETLRCFSLEFTCRGPGTIEFQKETKIAADRQREYLSAHGLSYDWKIRTDGRGLFQLRALVPVSFEFAADADQAAVTLHIRNLDALGVTNFHLAPDTVNDEFLDELGKCILRQPNRMAELSGNTISDEARQRLRDRLAEAERRRQAELAASAEKEGGKKKSLLERPIGRGFFKDR